jgi:hypothetical protein
LKKRQEVSSSDLAIEKFARLMFEDTNLFLRGIGETTDIVGKEMYTFKPSPESDESLTLRPEMTASVMRAYLQHSLGAQSPVVKVYYISELFPQRKTAERTLSAVLAIRRRVHWQRASRSRCGNDCHDDDDL